MVTQVDIIVRFTVEGWHRWSDAPPKRDYLASRHRHLFYVTVELQVFEDDREVEFHDLLDFCKQHFSGGELGGQSCETMGRELLENITRRYGGRRVVIEIFEDNEVGARIRYAPDLTDWSSSSASSDSSSPSRAMMTQRPSSKK